MKKFFMFLSYGVLIAIVVFLFESILSGRFCSCKSVKIYKPSDETIPVLTFKGNYEKASECN